MNTDIDSRVFVDQPKLLTQGEDSNQLSAATLKDELYKILLRLLPKRLNFLEVEMMKVWANRQFSITNAQNVDDVFFELDQNGVINASDLHYLSGFFDFILRMELVSITDGTAAGDYSFLCYAMANPNHIASVATFTDDLYKILLQFIPKHLNSLEAEELKIWANQQFSITNTENVTDILFELNQKGAINASDLKHLSGFFNSILRLDLVLIIDGTAVGDYSFLCYAME